MVFRMPVRNHEFATVLQQMSAPPAPALRIIVSHAFIAGDAVAVQREEAVIALGLGRHRRTVPAPGPTVYADPLPHADGGRSVRLLSRVTLVSLNEDPQRVSEAGIALVGGVHNLPVPCKLVDKVEQRQVAV